MTEEIKNTENTENKENKAVYESTAVKPHHRVERLISYDKRTDPLFKVRNILNIIFMLLAIGGLIIYVSTELTTLAYILLLIAVVLKIIEVGIRLK